jgi:hypothetical protein
VGGIRKTLPVQVAVALAFAGAGCGGDGDTTAAPPPETPQALPKLPERWQPHRDRSIGYAIGLPPGWEVSRSREDGVRVALIRSPDHLVAVSLVAIRDPEALETPLDEFATSALAALPGFEKPLEPSPPQPFGKTPFAAVKTMATGTTKGRGLEERATLLVLRREGIVTYTAAIVENAQRARSDKNRAVAMKMMHTLRGQPVGPAGTE